MSDTNALVIQAANGNEQAFNFMSQFLVLAHKVDDVIDGDTKFRYKIAEVFMEVVQFYSTDPFYLAHRALLYPIIIITMDAYTNSVLWEGQEGIDRQQLSDALRSTGIMVINFVALLTHGTVEGMRSISPQMVLDSWATHHNPDGTPK
jgi:hypothetical protein